MWFLFDFIPTKKTYLDAIVECKTLAEINAVHDRYKFAAMAFAICIGRILREYN